MPSETGCGQSATCWMDEASSVRRICHHAADVRHVLWHDRHPGMLLVMRETRDVLRIYKVSGSRTGGAGIQFSALVHCPGCTL